MPLLSGLGALGLSIIYAQRCTQRDIDESFACKTAVSKRLCQRGCARYLYSARVGHSGSLSPAGLLIQAKAAPLNKDNNSNHLQGSQSNPPRYTLQILSLTYIPPT